uniref:EF-hand calcium binding domain 2 n=1 Tax=Anas zonorhyncha TaxID=75864 RepID=A0A8B9UZR0_9AVES
MSDSAFTVGFFRITSASSKYLSCLPRYPFWCFCCHSTQIGNKSIGNSSVNLSFAFSMFLFADGAVAEIEKKIIEAFEVFDHECNKTVDVREIGSIVRSLGCFPTEAELQELLAKVEEEEEPTGYIHLEKFLPVMTKVLLNRSYRPIPEDVLLHAFEALDENKCGYLTKDELVKHMTEEGEPFTEEEIEEMLSSALDPETNTVHYRDYITMMIVDEPEDLPQ